MWLGQAHSRDLKISFPRKSIIRDQCFMFSQSLNIFGEQIKEISAFCFLMFSEWSMKLFGPTSDNALGSGELGSLSDPVGLVRGSAAERAQMRQATCEALWKLSARNLARTMCRTIDSVKVTFWTYKLQLGRNFQPSMQKGNFFIYFFHTWAFLIWHQYFMHSYTELRRSYLRFRRSFLPSSCLGFLLWNGHFSKPKSKSVRTCSMEVLCIQSDRFGWVQNPS